MAQLVIAAAGAAIGSWLAPVGWTFLGMSGAGIGWGVGLAIGGSLFAPTQKFEGPRLNDLRVTGTEYGAPIPWVQGHPRVAPCGIAWASEKREIAHTTSSGGKGGGGGSESTTYTYEVDVLYMLTANEMADVTRVWKNGKLTWSKLAASGVDSIEASLATDAWTRMTVYTGAASQLPDPDYETVVGTANAPAYRGRCTVFVKSLQLDGGGNLPNLTFEVSTTAAAGSPSTTNLATQDFTSPGVYWTAGPVGHAADGWFVYLGRWDNNYNNNDVLVYWYDVHTNTYTYRATITAGGSAGAYDSWTDKSCWVKGYYAGGATPSYLYMWEEDAGIFPMTTFVGPTGKQLSATFCRRGNWLLWSSTFDTYYKIGKYAVPAPGGSSAISAETTDQGNYFENVMLVGDDVYGKHISVSTIKRFDLATMTLQETFNTPLSTNNAYLFGGDSNNLWCRNLDNGIIYERVDGTWVARGTPATTPSNYWGGSEFTQMTVLGASIWDSTNTAASGTSRHYTFRLAPLGSSTPSDETVQNVVSRLCLRAGLAAGQFDVTALSSITRPVRALAVSQVGATRATLEMLAAAYFFECTVSDKIYFRPRGGSTVATIPFADLAASEGDEPPEPLALTLRTDIELPAHVAVTYANANDDYQPDTQLSDRLITAVSNTVQTVQVPLAMTPSEAKALADTLALDAQVALTGTQISVLGDYARLEPTDPVLATARDGSTFRLRLVKKTDSYPVQAFDAVLDDVSAISSPGITSADYTSSTTVVAVPATTLDLLDIPILRDADDDAGFYAAARGVSSPWPGAVVYGSRDDVQYEEKARVTESAVIGTCSTTLGNYSGPRIFDEASTVTVDIGYGTLTSSTRDTILNNQAVNAMLIGSEAIQFRDATLVSTGRYTLSGLLRGCRGTEWAMTGHAAGERCALLSMTGLRRVRMETSELGMSRYYRGVTIGRRLDSATAESFTNNGVGLKPFSPFDLRATRDGSGNITFTCQRRTRLAIRAIGTLGISIPLGEDSEAYDWLIYASGSYATLKRTLTSTTPTVQYTSAQQVTDFGSNQNPVYARVYQRSVQVGLGYKLEAAA